MHFENLSLLEEQQKIIKKKWTAAIAVLVFPADATDRFITAKSAIFPAPLGLRSIANTVFCSYIQKKYFFPYIPSKWNCNMGLCELSMQILQSCHLFVISALKLFSDL